MIHYGFVNRLVTNQDAVAECTAFGAKLFEPKDKATNEVVVTRFVEAFGASTQGYDVWIGITDSGSEGK